MIAKRCSSPKGGGSARAGVRYILGYAVGEKHGTLTHQNQAFADLMTQSRDRSDAGIGATWRPEGGDGRRPAAVFAEGFASLATADLEMEGWHAANGQTSEPVAHEVFSFPVADGHVSDERVVAAVRAAYQHADLGDAPKIIAIHRDTAHVHAHVIRSRIDPRTLRAYDHTMLNTRLDRGCRSAEMLDGKLSHDRGLVVVRETAEGTKYLDHSTYEERKAWRRANRANRLAEIERRQYDDVAIYEGSFDRYVDANVEPRIRAALREFKDANEAPIAIDILNAAARRGARLEIIGSGGSATAVLRNVSTAEFRQRQSATLRDYEASLSTMNGEQRDQALAEFRAQLAVALEHELQRIERDGELVPISAALQRELGDLEAYRDTSSAEEAFAQGLRSDPSVVARHITRTSATFSRDDIDRYIAHRVSDPGDLEHLTRYVINHDEQLVLLSPDVDGGVYTTREILATESALATVAGKLASTADQHFAAERLEASIREMEMERTTQLRSRGAVDEFRLSSQQRELIGRLQKRLVVCQGIAGAGKTTVMEVVRRYADATNRSVVGITLAQAAAERLENEAGFVSVNSALALMREKSGVEVIPRNGIAVVDEASMIDSRTMHTLVALAEERNATILAIGDRSQLSAIGAGNAFASLVKEAKAAETYSELTEIRRQRNSWHRDAVYAMDEGIAHDDATRISHAVQLWQDSGALHIRDSKSSAIRDAASWYLQQCKSGTTLLVSSDKDTARFLNEELRNQRGLATGRTYTTDQGRRDLASGDRFIFRQNSKQLRVWNGDTGTVHSLDRYLISIKLDRNDAIVSFDSRQYKSWDHGYATTIHAAQGASISAVGVIMDDSATAQLAHVATSRSRDKLAVFTSSRDFATPQCVAEHLAARIEVKTTTLNIGPIVASRGGVDTYVALNARSRLLSRENDLIAAYEREQSLKHATLSSEIAEVRDRYRRLRASSAPSERSRLTSLQYAEEKKLVAAYAPDKKGEWLSTQRHATHADSDKTTVSQSTTKKEHNMSQGPAYLQEELRKLRMTYDQWIAQFSERWHQVTEESERGVRPPHAPRNVRIEEVSQTNAQLRGSTGTAATVHYDARGKVAFVDRGEALHSRMVELGAERSGSIARPFEIDVPNPTRENISAALTHYKDRYSGYGELATLRFAGDDRVTKIWVEEARRIGLSVEHSHSHDDRLAAYAKANDRSIRDAKGHEIVEGRVMRIQYRENGAATVLINQTNAPKEFVKLELSPERADQIALGDKVRCHDESIERIQQVQREHEVDRGR